MRKGTLIRASLDSRNQITSNEIRVMRTRQSRKSNNLISPCAAMEATIELISAMLNVMLTALCGQRGAFYTCSSGNMPDQRLLYYSAENILTQVSGKEIFSSSNFTPNNTQNQPRKMSSPFPQSGCSSKSADGRTEALLRNKCQLVLVRTV